ncbi:SDR family oxidoreductase [Sphingomonas olei]|uniref:SDR family oxidoreductase n=1 Tax=Sphingomonas olei TaxID=1886787 RepID=A0ABY2QMX9_9SPHN|nr:SDR family oxidoreductase [Sphingomonas olei]THG42203.1 SDR family oxidoreductase [Sphingomonas olei]
MKAILITGGGSGIGRAVAQLFVDRGWRVGLADRDSAGLKETAALLPAERTSCHVMDVRSPEDWEEVLAEFAQLSGGRLDVLFNNAGVAVGGPFGAAGLEDIDRAVDVNLKGVLYGARMAYPFLAATPGSCLLNTASAAGIYGTPGAAVYSATKFAVRGLTEALDGEWAADDIRVRSLMPGFIDTPLLQAGVGGSNRSVRETVVEAGLEFTPVEVVAQAAWEAVHGGRVHTLVGKTARRLSFASRWMPGSLRKRMRGGRAL